ncbi:hypothetical protein HXX76_004976 [Chlamydomonas incerta]|uniref:Uncharacterized protein n=1 Tax=Chlamydomonas incerta TaxID=51695 RepID=A0A835TFZ7_CHLIN|nr:hypothetical protein HXX76_004976 [Chlamydomonas incerta]|eukprot:KAG2439624.1 hypothetical protein HXX76_004976 [Chlamydomonas incerta]
MGWLLSSLGHVTASRVPVSTRGQRRPAGCGTQPARAGPSTSDFPPSVSAGAQAASASQPARLGTSDLRLPPVPAALQRQLASSRATWLRHCLESPLLDSVTNSRVHLLGAAHFAPHGGGAGLLELQELVSTLRPTVLAIEQPFDLASRAGLAYPEVLQRLEEEALACGGGGGGAAANAGLVLGLGVGVVASALAGADPDGSSNSGRGGSVRGQEPGLVAAAAAAARLREALPGLAQRARVGRDLLDPFEVLGLYSGCDYVTRPEQLAEALALFGFLPGLEYVALAQAAEQTGAQVYSVDAPLKLQEKWVEQLVAGYKLRESDLSRRLQYDLARAQSLLPPDFHAWDAALAAAVQAREQLRLQAQAQAQGQGDQAAGAGAEPPLEAVTAFKVSRALAAALLPFDRSHEAFGLQASLQPLKYGLFTRRARHLVLQVRDLCQRMSVRQVRVDAESVKNGAATPGAQSSAPPPQPSPQQRDQTQQQAQLVDVTGQPEQVVLAVVGRQYVHYIREMWANERSALWHGEVPRTFAPSSLER